MGLGLILGGAMQGYGAGLAKQADMDYTAKHEAAIAALKAQADTADDARKQSYAQDNIRLTGQINAENQAGHDNRDAASARILKAQEAAAKRDEASFASQLDTDKQLRLRRFDLAAEAYKTTNAALLKEGLDNGTYSDAKIDASGNYVVFNSKTGQPLQTGIPAQPPKETGAAGAIGNVGKPPQFHSDAEVTIFMSDPKNKGKSFIAPDASGKPTAYKVP